MNRDHLISKHFDAMLDVWLSSDGESPESRKDMLLSYVNSMASDLLFALGAGFLLTPN